MASTDLIDDFDGADADSDRPKGSVLHVDVNGFEGPLDLLLDMARRQKVDLAQISVLALAEQYLAFIEKVRSQRIEIAADYLVMAAWLAYLKSRLMVPQAPSDDEPSGEMLAAMLQFRLKRLEAMRDAVQKLTTRNQLGLHIFARGAPEPVVRVSNSDWDASLIDLLKAYGSIRERRVEGGYVPLKRTVWALQDAREILVRLVGQSAEWMALDSFLVDYLASDEERVTALASSFSASLELVREGKLEIRQTLTFGPLMLRRRQTD